MTDIICELLSIKEPQTTLQSKETILQSYRKMSNQNTKKSPGIKVALFNCTEGMGLDNFGCLNNSLSLFYCYFVSNLPKKNYGVRRLTAEPPSPPNTSQYAFSWTTPLPTECTYFINEPLVNSLS